MGDLSENFSRKEVACECGCGFDTADTKIVEAGEDLRDHFESKYQKVIVRISGGNRCHKHNEYVQLLNDKNYIPNSSKSQHKEAKAWDIKVFRYINDQWVQVDTKEVYDYLDKKYPDSYGVGLYDGFNHLDVRSKKARWGDK